MDANPWTYAVSVREVRREGRVHESRASRIGQAPGPAPLRDPGSLRGDPRRHDGVLHRRARPRGGSTRWHDSEAGLPRFRIGRRATEFPNGCFRGAVALPAGTAPADIVGLRTRAFTRIAGKDEPPLPKGAGSARLERVNTLFLLGEDDQPMPSLFSWRGAVDLIPEGPAFELRIRD